MRLGKSPTTSSVLIVLSVLLVGLLSGCGGGDQSGGGADGGAGGGGQEGGGDGAKKAAPERKIALGTVKTANEEKRRIYLQPAAEVQGSDSLGFKVRKNAEITLGTQKAELGDARAGQQAQIEYVVKNEINRAVAVQLFKGGGQGTEGGEKTG
jgi:hypothetical protein